MAQGQLFGADGNQKDPGVSALLGDHLFPGGIWVQIAVVQGQLHAQMEIRSDSLILVVFCPALTHYGSSYHPDKSVQLLK